MDGKNETGGTGEEVLSSEFWVLSWQSGRECGMRNVECGMLERDERDALGMLNDKC